MEAYIKDKLIARISSGTIRYKTASQILTLRPLSAETKYIGEEMYEEAYLSAQSEGLYNEVELMRMLLDNDLWSGPEEDRLVTCLKNLDEFKLKYFQIKFKENERKKVKEAIALTKTEILNLQNRKHKYDYLTCSGYAAAVKLRFLTAMSIHTTAPMFSSVYDYLDYDGSLINKVLMHLQENLISEVAFRELARTEPWRIVWNTRKACANVFDCAAVGFTDEQRQLVTWSIVYDNVHESSDCPAESIISDDDALDGWFISQRNKREKNDMESEKDRILNNPRLKDAHEIYLMAETAADAKAINAMNDDATQALVQKRIETVKKKGGTLHELEMPDTKQRLTIAFNERFKKHMG